MERWGYIARNPGFFPVCVVLFFALSPELPKKLIAPRPRVERKASDPASA